MAEKLKEFWQVELPSTVTSIFTATKDSLIKHIRFSNTTDQQKSFRLYQNGTTDLHVIKETIIISKRGLYEMDTNIVVEAGNEIYAEASAANAISSIAYGMEAD